MGLIISATNAVDRGATILTTSSEVAPLGLRALLTPQIADVWRSGAWGSSADIELRVDLGSETAVDVIAVRAPSSGVLPSASAQWRVTGGSGGPDSTTAINTGFQALAMAPLGQAVLLLPDQKTLRYVRLTFRAGSGDRYFQIGRLWIGAAYRLACAVSYGEARGYEDTGVNDRAGLTGIRYSQAGIVQRTRSWRISSMLQADANMLDAVALTAGTTQQILASPFSDDISRHAIIGTMTRMPEPQQNTYARWTAEMAMREDG